MSTISNDRSEFWASHFVQLANSEATNTKQLDFSNHALVVQNYAYVLESIGPLADKRVLDAGFGTGELSRILDLLGAKVSAIDLVATRIPTLREEVPNVAWWQGDLGEWTLPQNAEPFDVIVAAETLQYVDFDDAVQRLLSALAPKGRLLVLIPNADCPIIQKTSERFDHRYTGVSLKGLSERVRGIVTKQSAVDSRAWRVFYRGIRFQDDQTVVPYQSGPWVEADLEPVASSANRVRPPHFDNAKVPNRLVMVFCDSAIED